MKKITLKFLMTALLLLGAINVLADEISWTGQADWTGIGGASISLTSGDYTVKVDKNNGGSNPTVNGTAKDLRAYAKATVTIEAKKNMNTIVFKISAQGKKRMTDITATTGTVNFDDKAWTLTWTGSASSVSFTVGEKATYGSDGESKAGQFDVDSPITVVAEGGGTYVAAPAFTPAPGTYPIWILDGTTYSTLNEVGYKNDEAGTLRQLSKPMPRMLMETRALQLKLNTPSSISAT